jgi:hypothetical protein
MRCLLKVTSSHLELPYARKQDEHCISVKENLNRIDSRTMKHFHYYLYLHLIDASWSPMLYASGWAAMHKDRILRSGPSVGTFTTFLI